MPGQSALQQEVCFGHFPDFQIAHHIVLHILNMVLFPRLGVLSINRYAVRADQQRFGVGDLSNQTKEEESLLFDLVDCRFRLMWPPSNKGKLGALALRSTTNLDAAAL